MQQHHGLPSKVGPRPANTMHTSLSLIVKEECIGTVVQYSRKNQKVVMDIDKEIFDDADQEVLPPEFDTMTAEDIQRRIRLLDNEIRVLKDDSTRLGLEQSGLKEKVKDNKEKIKLNNQLPYLVSNIVEVLEVRAISGPVYLFWDSLPGF